MEIKTSMEYRELLEKDYPEELGPNGFVERLRESCLYMEQHPQKWAEYPEWFRNLYREDKERAILAYSWTFLESFA